ncbi:MAG: hypothetical protein M3Q60_15210 [Actinomycetota bacterium]|nr:hypothetical protein [Actinomycetota bacterium]
MAGCDGFKPDGSPCGRIVGASQRYCYAHDPARAGARRRNASKAARSKPSRELATLKGRLSDLYADVREGRLDPKVGAVVNQILNTSVRVVNLERDLREQEELAARIEELERVAEERGWAGVT